MASDLRDQLQTTLGESYTLERELGGGGMSRVFVAEEIRLGRKVVVKVLSPELAAGVSAERFEREIRLAASLQQANIVPVLAAGDTQGLPYYTMPFVEGESLRRQLGPGRLSVTAATGILRDVARALAYAHEHGVVHRDIKPDNVLISGGTAVVTDFGIAKAISASRTEAAAATLTQLGTSVGTPAYMSPEQAAGDPHIDHRADIYAFGCMAYELLTGQPPFHGQSPQRILAAHMSEVPQPITELRADVPPALAELIMRSLAKDADARPRSASELLRVLESVTSGEAAGLSPFAVGGGADFRRALLVYAVVFIAVAILARAAMIAIGLPDWVYPGALIVMALGLPVILFTGYVQQATQHALTARPTRTPGGGTRPGGALAAMAMKAAPHVSWRRTTRGGIYALAAFATVVAVFMTLREFGVGPAGSLLGAGKLKSSEPLLVADFAIAGPDSGLSGVLAEAMRTSLSDSRVITLYPPTSIADALERMARPRTTPLDAPTAREMAQREGIKAIVEGQVTPLGTGFVVNVRLVAAGSGEHLASFQETVDGDRELLPAIDRLSRKLRGRIGESLRSIRDDPPLSEATTASLEAFKLFSEGYRANSIEGDFDKAIRLLSEATAIDTMFGSAYRLLGQAIGNAGGPAERVRLNYEKAYRLRNRMSELERLLATGVYFQPSGHYDRAASIGAFEDLVKRTGGTYAMNLGQQYWSRREFARADSLYALDIKARPAIAISYFTRVATLIDAGNLADARAALDAARARFPDDYRGYDLSAALSYAAGNLDSAAKTYSALRSHRVVLGRVFAEIGLANIALLRGQIREAGRHAENLRDLGESRGQARFPLADSLSSATRQLLLFKRPAIAVGIIDAALRATPLASVPSARRPYLQISRLYALASEPTRARQMLREYEVAVTDTFQRRVDLTTWHFANGWVTLAENRPMEAIAEFRRGDMLPDGPATACTVCIDPALARAFDAAGMRDSAIAVLEHFVSTPAVRKLGIASEELPWMLQRLGELYEAKGDRTGAAVPYRKFVELWKNADPELQPQVAAVQRRLASLAASPR